MPSTWSNNDLSVMTGSVAAVNHGSGLPFGFAWENNPNGSSIHIVYVDGLFHIQELSKIGRGNWASADLTEMTGATTVGGLDTPVGFDYLADPRDPRDPSIHIVYRDSNRRIHELSKVGPGDWGHYDLTAMTGAPDTQVAPFGFAYPSDPSIHVIYLGFDLHIHELSKVGTGSWGHYDLTAMTGAPLGFLNSTPFGFVYPSDPSMHVVYEGFDRHIHELSKVGTGNWGHYDLTAMTRAPLTGSAPVAFANHGDPSMHVLYWADRHIQELSKVGTGDWKHYDLTATTGAPMAVTIPSLPILGWGTRFVGNGFSWEHDPGGSSMHVVYLADLGLGGEKSICQLYKVSGGNWGLETIPTLQGTPLHPGPSGSDLSIPFGFAWEKDSGGSSLHVVYLGNPQSPSYMSHVVDAVLSL